MAVTYRSFAKDYTVWVFSRKNGLSVGCTTRDMARDREIAARIPGAKLRMYAQWGHGVYEEARDFNRTVLDFLNSK